MPANLTSSNISSQPLNDDIFAEIRPYDDGEFRQVIDRISQDPTLTAVLAKAATSNALVQPLVRKWLAWRLKHKFAEMEHIGDFQDWLAYYVEKMLSTTTSGLTVSGLDKLDDNQDYLWLSNHRDIALDPTLVNYALHLSGNDTGRIAIGDNLLTDPLVADIMRLNKSFVVKRSVQSKREKLAVLQQLSEYILHSINTGHSVWLAQQEGRAKDGIDKTDTAVLKMLSLAGRKTKQGFSESLQALNPIAVTISYEYDPCDLLKARELVAANNNPHYSKPEGEDIKSIMLGIKEPKGQVHVAFGSPVDDELFADANLLAQELDRQMVANYKLFDINYAAHHLIAYGSINSQENEVRPLENYPDDLTEAMDWLKNRVAEEKSEVKTQLFSMYAQPVIAQQNAGIIQ